MSVFRDLRDDDAEAVAALFAEEYGGQRLLDAEDVRAWLRNPELRPEHLRVLEERGRIAGYGDIFPQGDEVALDLAAPGRWAPFFDWGETHARESGAGRVRFSVPDGHPLTAFAAARGYRLFRSSFLMEISLTEEPTRPSLPSGLTLRPYRAEHAAPLRVALNEAFADDWNWHTIDESNYEAFYLEARGADPSLWSIAWDAREIAGYALAFSERGGDATLGWVGTLGVRAPWRRRGLGEAVLRSAFCDLYDRGLRRVGLGVDAENPTALQLYERAGMHIVQQNDNWVLDL